MKIDIANEKYNPFMKRKEIVVDIENPEEATPSKAQLTELIAKHANKEADHIEIIRILSGRGLPKATARVFVWDEKRAAKSVKKAEAETKAESQQAAAPPAAQKTA